MKAFPPELSDLLDPTGRALLSGRRRVRPFGTRGRPPIAIFPDVIPRATARECVALLDRHLHPLTRSGKSARIRSAVIGGPNAHSRPARAAGLIGLSTLLDSRSLQRFVERATGLRLGNARDQRAICYDPGEETADDPRAAGGCPQPGCIDVHLMFGTPGLAAQALDYVREGSRSESVAVGTTSGIAVHRAPAWHYRFGRPARRRAGRPGRRWLVLASYEIERSPRSLPFKVRRSGIQGRGVFATRRIPAGARIIEYVGERISDDEAAARYDDDSQQRHHTFLFSIARDVSIDAAVGGNESRFINHGCEPNCIAYLDDGRVFIEALADIRPGVELTYDYGLSRDERRRPSWRALYACACGAPRCRGTMIR